MERPIRGSLDLHRRHAALSESSAVIDIDRRHSMSFQRGSSRHDPPLDIYCGNIDPDLRNDVLEREFRNVFGHSARLVGRCASSKTVGGPEFCFFKFLSSDEYRRTLQIIARDSHPLVINGRSIVVRLRETLKEKDDRLSQHPGSLSNRGDQSALPGASTTVKRMTDNGKRSNTPPVLCLYSSVVLIVSNLPQDMIQPKSVFEYFDGFEPIAAFVYPDVNQENMRYGEVQFRDGDCARQALIFAHGAVVGDKKLWYHQCMFVSITADISVVTIVRSDSSLHKR